MFKVLALCALLIVQLAGLASAEQIHSVARCRQGSALLAEALETMAAAIGQAQNRAGPGSYDRIDHDLSQWIDIARHEQQQYCLAELLRLRWHVRFQQDNLEAGEPLLAEALQQFAPQDRLDRQRTGALSNLSYHYVLTGRFVEATQVIRELIAISIELQDPRSLATNYHLIADTYLKLGEADTAKRYFQYSMAPYALVDETAHYAALSKLATIERIKGNYDQALQGHMQTLAHFQIENTYRSIPASIEIARDHLVMGNYDLAEQYANLAWSDPRALLEQRIDAGLVLFDSATKRQRPAAERMRLALRTLIDRALASSREANPIQQIEYAIASVRYFASRNELERVLAAAREGLELSRRLGVDTNRSGVNAMAWASRIDGLMEALARYLWDKDPRYLAQLMDRVQATSTVPVDLGSPGDREFQLLNQLAALERTLVDQQGIQSVVTAEHVRYLRTLANRRDMAREAYIQVRSDRTMARNPVAAPRAADIAPFEPAGDEIQLRYYVRPSISILLVSSGSDVSAVPLPPLTAISELVEHARLAIHDPNLPDVRAPLRALAALLPMAQLKTRQTKRILLVTDESTFSIPFAAIDLGEGTQLYRPLGTEFELVQVSHLESYARADHQQITTSSSVAMFASPTFSVAASDALGVVPQGWLHNLPKLDFSHAEAQTVSKLFADRPLHLFLGADATAENLLSEQARTARILHISTHGYFSPDLAHVVGLAVAGSGRETGFVSQNQLLSRPFHNALIVLGSCDSLQGQRYRGVGSYGLGQALIEQGTPVVVGTLWRIPDASAAAFMTQFYRHLLASEGNTGYAMTQARSELIKGRVYAHPRHWAGLTLLSRNRSIERKLFPAIRAVESER
jgi:CHAT domain-containing protein